MCMQGCMQGFIATLHMRHQKHVYTYIKKRRERNLSACNRQAIVTSRTKGPPTYECSCTREGQENAGIKFRRDKPRLLTSVRSVRLRASTLVTLTRHPLYMTFSLLITF